MSTPTSPTKTISKMSESQLAVQEPSIGSMLHAVIEKGVTPENVAVLDKMFDLYERTQAKDAERAFASAFVELQAEMPAVEATRSVPNNDGTLRYKFAPYEEIMETVRPFLKKHGFTVTFDTDVADGRMIVICTLMHVGGHNRSNKFAVRIGRGAPGTNEMQADGGAKTYAKRGALCDALNIIVEHDDDGRAEGATISSEKAEELKRRIAACNADQARFLKLAGAQSFEQIPAEKLDILEEMLRKKEAKTTTHTEEKNADGSYKW